MSLTAAQEAHAITMRRAVHQHCPELLPVIKDLVQHELIEGWRNVASVLDCGPPRPRNSITADIYLENSKPMNTK